MYAVIDLETTGGDFKRSRIIEIAIVVHDGEKVVDEYQTLVNPETVIPEFITRITGINTGMVRDAPKFYEVAKKVVEITEGCIFVAHNVRFDYSFVKNEFASLGFNYQRKQLCTVRLSRKLIPGLPSYSLGKLCKSLGIEIQDRHRAMGDAAATVKLLEMLLERGEGNLESQIKYEIKKASRPPNVKEETVVNLPQETGVYYFHDAEGSVIYVGKSLNIRDRVLSHFQSDLKQNRFFRLKERLHDITYEVTGSELVALLHESGEIKKIQPEFNRAQRSTRSRYKYGLYAYYDQRGYLQMKVGPLAKGMTPITKFPTKSRAEGTLRNRQEEFVLCKQLTGLEKGNGPCFHHQIGKCLGACAGNESPEDYNARAEAALEDFNYKCRSFFVIGPGRMASEKSVVWVEEAVYQGYGYVDAEMGWEDPEQLKEVVKVVPDHPEYHQIIRSYLRSNKQDLFIPLDSNPSLRSISA